MTTPQPQQKKLKASDLFDVDPTTERNSMTQQTDGVSEQPIEVRPIANGYSIVIWETGVSLRHEDGRTWSDAVRAMHHLIDAISQAKDTSKVTRLEVIDWTKNKRYGGARAFVHRDEKTSIIQQLQDEKTSVIQQLQDEKTSVIQQLQDQGRTLKLFITDNEEAKKRLNIDKPDLF